MKANYLKTLITTFLLLLCSLYGYAIDFKVDGICYNVISIVDMTCEVTSNFYSGDVVIPSSVNYNSKNYKVTSIGVSAFGFCSGLTSITIPNSITSIGEYAFEQCSGLTSITIPSSVTSIGDGTFEGCSGLTSITIPNSVTSIGTSAFYGCEGLTSITIPNSVTSIGDQAFSYCRSLTSITIPSSVTSIGVGEFFGCSSLTSITIPSSVTSIGTSAFGNCSGLTSITIPNSVTSIGTSAFWYCSGLTSITIPSSVTSIGDGTFSHCSGLTLITVDSQNTYYDSRDNCNAIISTKDNYLISGCKNTVIPNTIISIGDEAFRGCSGLTSITIPNSITSIGDEAFSGCSGLTSITIPNSITSIGDYAFTWCSKLASINIPSSVTSIGDEAFARSWSLKYVTLESETPISITSNIIEGITPTVIVPQSAIGAYLSAEYWKDMELSVGGLSPITTSTYDFTSPTTLNPAIEPSEDEDTGINISTNTMSSGDVSLTFGLGTRTQSYSAREWTNSDGTYNLRVYNGATMKISVPEHCYIAKILFSGDDVSGISASEGTLTDDIWTGNSNSVTFSVTASLNAKISTIIVTYYSIEQNLADGSTYDNLVDVKNQHINYTRTFNNTSWQALYVPFSMSYEDWSENYDIAKINDTHMYDTDDDGSIDEMELEVVKIKSGNILPNHPYLIRAKSTGEQTITLENATLYAAENNSIDCSSVETKYVFTGTYSTISQSYLTSMGARFMSGGSLVSAGSDLGSYRWYMTTEDRDGQIVSTNANIKIRVIGEDATDISSTEIEALEPVAYYSTNGTRLAEPQKGLNIAKYADGSVKKIMIK